jgi:hypothetical protein
LNFRHKHFSITMLGLAVLASALLFTQTCSAQTAGWKPDSKALALLAPEVRLGDYSIKPPKGFKYDTAHRGQASMYAWSGAGATKDFTPTFLIISLPLSEKDKMKRQEDQLALVMAGIKKKQSAQTRNWKFAHRESGKVNGIPMVRVHYSAEMITGNRKVRGFCYVCLVGSNGFIFSDQDLDPDGAQRLKAAEASVLTFRKL